MYLEKVNPKVCDKLCLMNVVQFNNFYNNEHKEDGNDDDIYKQYNKIVKYCREMKKTNYERNTSYSPSNSTPNGRLFSVGPSLQNIWKMFRGVLCNGLYIDIDMKNAHPTILLYLCKMNNINDVKYLYEYINNRSYLLGVLSTELNISLEDAKQLFIISMNSHYNITKNGKKKIKNEFFINFDKEMKYIQKTIYSFYSKDYNDLPEENKEGKLLNRLLCTHENILLQRVIEYNKNNNIDTGVLMFDGLMIYNKNYNNEFLKKYIDELDNITNDYNVKWAVKPFDISIMDTIMNFKERITFMNTIECAEHILKNILSNKIVRCNGEFWFNDNNLWSVYCDKEIERHLYLIVSQQDHLLQTENAKEEIKFIEFCKIDKYIREIIRAIIAMTPINNNLRQQLYTDTMHKLCFRNGFYDFEKNQFFTEYNFKTPVIIDSNYDNNVFEEDIKELYNRIFYPIFGNNDILIDYYLHRIARSIGGYTIDKKVHVLQGLRNSGKGCLTELLYNSFGPYINSIDAGNFVYKKDVSQDSAKQLSWIIPHMFSRISLTHEIKTGDNVYLDGNIIKKFSSGGDKIRARLNHKDEIEFNIQSTLWINCNDLPEAKPKDCMEFVDTFELMTKFIDENEKITKLEGYTYLPKDDYVKNVLPKEKRIVNAFIYLVIQAFNKKCTIPEQIEQDKEDIDEEDDYNKFFELFEFTGNEKDIITNEQLKQIIKNNNIIFTAIKASKLLQRKKCKKFRDAKTRGLSGLKLRRIVNEIMNETSDLDS